MCEVKIVERIVVDEPQNVEIAIFNLTGKKVAFELIRKFILQEKNTFFYLDQKLNSSMEPGYYSDYLWLDTGFRDEKNQPIMICFHNGYNGYVGHYTGPVRELMGRLKSFHKKNAKDIDRNYSRFLSKYQTRAEERDVVMITDPRTYAVTLANKEAADGQESAFALALKSAGIDRTALPDDEVEEIPEVMEVVAEEEFTEEQQELTIGLLVDQMQSMQQIIDDLLMKLEKHEKTSQEEIDSLRAQNREYKNALVQIRQFNEENVKEEELSEEDMVQGHNLLGKNEKILILGNTEIRVAEMRAIARDYFGFEKVDIEFITDYDKLPAAGGRVHDSRRFAAIIFGNCPHKVAGMGNHSSMIEEFKQRENCAISVDARTQAGGLKITKQSFRNALTKVYLELKNKQVA